MLTREQLTREAASLRQTQARGYGLPSAKRLGDDLQAIQARIVASMAVHRRGR